uniref:RING-type E3 ubiquitin transferase n=1 Tax=Aegilops tauschii subsp. strangulata TaxID=200361 RepID=A0A453PUI2_AEGTS
AAVASAGMGKYDDGGGGGSYPLVAVCIDKDKNSQNALKYATETLVHRGQTLVLVHVNTRGSSGGVEDAAGYKQPTDPQMKDLFLPFRCFCTRKDIQCKDVLLDDHDVAKSLVEFAAHAAVERLVLGANTRSSFVRFKADVPNSVCKTAPDFTSVYVVNKGGKVTSVRQAIRPAPSVSPLRTMIQGGGAGAAKPPEPQQLAAAPAAAAAQKWAAPTPPQATRGPDDDVGEEVPGLLADGVVGHILHRGGPDPAAERGPERRSVVPTAAVHRVGHLRAQQLRGAALGVGSRHLRQREHLQLPYQRLLLPPRGGHGGGDAAAPAGAEADHGHVQHGVQGGAHRQAEGHGAAALEGGGAAVAGRPAHGGDGAGAHRAGEGQGAGGHRGGRGVAAPGGAGGPEADRRGEEGAQGGRRRLVGEVPPVHHRGNRGGHGALLRLAQGGRGRLRPGVQGPARPHPRGHQGAPAGRRAGQGAVPAGGGGAQLHPPPQHGAPPRRLPGVRLPGVRVHGHGQPGRLPLPARRRAGAPLAAPVPHRRRDRHGPALPPPGQAGAAGPPRPEAGQHPPRPQLREQDQRRRARPAGAAVGGRHGDAVPHDERRGHLLLHRPGVPADGDAGRQVGRLLAGRDAAADHHGAAAHGADPPRGARAGPRHHRRPARPGLARLARGRGAAVRGDVAALLRAPAQGPARPGHRRAPGAQPAARARRGQHAVLQPDDGRHGRRRRLAHRHDQLRLHEQLRHVAVTAGARKKTNTIDHPPFLTLLVADDPH